MTQLRRVNKKWEAVHAFHDCTVPRLDLGVASAARQAIEGLNPDMGPSDVSAARRVIGKMLDRLEQLEKTTVTVVPTPPLLLTAAKEHQRPQIVRELTRARAMHLEWMARKDGAA
jgi:hypothetical protein